MSDTAITVTIDAKTLEALHLLADLAVVTVEESARRTLTAAALEAASNLDACIQEGEDAIDWGEFLTYDEVKAWLATERADVLEELERAKAA